MPKPLVLALAAASLCCAHAQRPSGLQELIATDSAFARAATERGVDGWMQYMADDARMLQSGGGEAHGRDDIRRSMEVLGTAGNPGTLRLEWRPLGGEEHGELGYTFGNYVAYTPRGERRGKYATFWRREPSGWKVVLDIGNDGEIQR